MSSKKIIRIGTRKPPLAMRQAEEVVEQLIAKCGDEYDFQIVGFTTTGDRIQDRTLYDIGGKALFLKEVELALYNNEIDIAVHSLKDVPGVESEDLNIAALTASHDVHDVLIANNANSIAELPSGSVVGTSSMRRIVFLKSFRTDLVIKNIRGNIITRVDKWKRGEYDAIILAAAGLNRLNMFDDTCSTLNAKEFTPAVGQGVLALQVRGNDNLAAQICRTIACKNTESLMAIERSFLARLDATCKTPTAAHAYFTNEEKTAITIDFMLAGQDMIPRTITKHISIDGNIERQKLAQVGIDAAEELLHIVKSHTEPL